MPQKEKELLVAQDALSTSQREQQELIKIKQELQLVFEKQQKLVDQIKKSNQTRQKLQHEKIVIQRSQTDLAEQQTRLAEKIKQVDSKRKALLIDDSYSIEMINQEADSVHSQLDQITVEKHHFESTSAQLQSQIKELQVEITKSKESQNKLSAINDQIKANKPVLATQESLEKEKENLDQETNSIQLKKATCQNQLYDLTQKKQKIEFLTKCPTCEQSVPEDHCNKIKQQISEDTQKLQQTKDQLINQEQAAQVSIKSVLTRLRELKQIQETQNKLLQEQASLKAFVSHHEQSNSKLKEKVIENNSLMDKFQEFLSLKLPLREDLQKRIASLQNRKEQTLLAVQLKNQVSELTIEQSTLNQKFSGQLITLKNIETNLQTLPDDAKRLLEFENSLELARNNLESKKIGLSKQDQIVLHQKQILDNLQVELQQLRKIKTNLLKTKELARWIDGKFIPLTQHIEREIMLKIYHYCNELFSEWFEILTEGSELSASLDSGFAPIIEQQGHEIAFAYLSGGERTAASLAYRLALTKAINHVMQQINTKELLILDEPTDGFSAEQLQRLRDCLETIGLKQILIVSHEAMMEGFVNHILNVEKRSGVSSVH
ncbi:hypothetical protein CL619_01300 [archaeon]|nr:hypothetical protein [archaeon]